MAGPEALSGLTASAERFIPGGVELGAGPERPRLYAEGLLEFVRVAAGFPGQIELDPPLPWVGWNHVGPGLWPPPDDLDADLNAHTEPAWLDEIGRRVKARLLRDTNPRVIGHADWWPPNLRWIGNRLHSVFDWDSLGYLSEAALAGATAAMFADDWPAVTPMAETAAFIDAYAHARGSPWSSDEREFCWAAGLWLMAFNAKKQPLQGVTETLEHLREFGAEKLRRAGA